MSQGLENEHLMKELKKEFLKYKKCNKSVLPLPPGYAVKWWLFSLLEI